MKKLLAFLLVFTMLFALAACGSGDETSNNSSNGTSSTESTASTTSSKSTSSESSSAASSAAKSTASSAASSAASSVATSSGTTSTPAGTPQFTNKFISFGTDVNTQVTANDKTSIRLTKINQAVVPGDVALFTKAFGTSLKSGSETYKDFAVLVCTYDHTIFGYKKTSLVTNESDKSSTAIPADGFVAVISKNQKTEYSNLSKIQDGFKFFVHGVQIGDLGFTVKKATTAPTIDGKITATEYGGKAIWVVNEKNKLWDYSQFPKDNYYVTADVYATYDANNFYLGVVVSTPENYNPCTAANATDMWKYYCIQANLYAEDPLGDYMSKHFDYVSDSAARTEGKIRQYGFGVNDKGETLSYVWMGIDSKFTGTAKVVRDNGAQKTYYEVSIPWKELGTTAKPFSISGIKKVGFALSINATNQADDKAGKWKNLKMRDGGGIIGRNDFTKGASVTLG